MIIYSTHYYFFSINSLVYQYPIFQIMSFTIAGSASSPKLAYAISIAKYLHRNLPSFEYEVQLRTQDEWPAYLRQLQLLYGFTSSDCPTILEEGRLVGGLQQWKDLVYSSPLTCFVIISLFLSTRLLIVTTVTLISLIKSA